MADKKVRMKDLSNVEKKQKRNRVRRNRIRAAERKRVQNIERRTALRTMLKKTEAAIAAKDMQLAQELYCQAAGKLDCSARKGIIKKGTADRKKSRLALKINKIAAA